MPELRRTLHMYACIHVCAGKQLRTQNLNWLRLNLWEDWKETGRQYWYGQLYTDIWTVVACNRTHCHIHTEVVSGEIILDVFVWTCVLCLTPTSMEIMEWCVVLHWWSTAPLPLTQPHKLLRGTTRWRSPRKHLYRAIMILPGKKKQLHGNGLLQMRVCLPVFDVLIWNYVEWFWYYILYYLLWRPFCYECNTCLDNLLSLRFMTVICF